MITPEQKLACARRELGLREHVYPKRVKSRAMSQEKADFELAVMRAIVEDYRGQVEGERLL
jgi:hypothetical protein